MSSDANHLQQALNNLRNTLAQKRATRRAQTDAQMSEFASSSDCSPSSASALLDQASRAQSVLGQLQEIQHQPKQAIANTPQAAMGQAPETGVAALTPTASLITPPAIDPKIPDAEEIAAFRQALLS
ncbi:MAG: hypothetical protein ACH34Y_03830 [Brachymonas sp.]